MQHYNVDSRFLSDDFIDMTGKAMSTLQCAGKDNLLYYLAVGLGKERPDGSGPRLPVDRMPFGLLSHNIKFFAVEDTACIKPEDHYIEWQTTMFSHFGHKWDKLFRGPMWSYDGDSDNENDDEENAHESQTTGRCKELMNKSVDTENERREEQILDINRNFNHIEKFQQHKS